MGFEVYPDEMLEYGSVKRKSVVLNICLIKTNIAFGNQRIKGFSSQKSLSNVSVLYEFHILI